MFDQHIKGFLLGFLTCSTFFLIYTVNYKSVAEQRKQLVANEDNEPTTVIKPTQISLPASIDKRSSRLPVEMKLRTNQPRILCWVMTSPETIDERAFHVKKTWGRRCDQTLFFSSHSNETFPCIGLNTTEGRRHLWAKTNGAFMYIYKHYFDQFDWFMKADDDTYVIVENLRHFLSRRDPNEAVYYGHQFKDALSQVYSGYNSGGSGYVLSKEALRKFGINSTRYRQYCPRDGPDEDLYMGACLRRLGVKTVNTSDEDGFITFFCFETELHVTGKYPLWYTQRGVHRNQMGIGNFSRHAISFHYIKPWMMYWLDYFVYRFSLKKDFGDSDIYTLQQNDWILRSTELG